MKTVPYLPQVDLEAQTAEEKQTDGHEPQAEGKPETFQPSDIPGEHLEVEAQERPGGQQIVSEISRPGVGPSGEPTAQSITEPAADVGKPGEEEKRRIAQEAIEDTEKDSEDFRAERPQAPETPDTVTSEQDEQAEVISIGQPQESVGEEYTYPAVTAHEQATFGQTQEIFNPQQVLQKEIVVEQMKVAK